MRQRRISPHRVPIEAIDPFIQKIMADTGIPADFSADARREAERAAQCGIPQWQELPCRTDIPLVTIDPEGSRDLDQAVALARTDHGMRVIYAIAAVGLFMTPDGPLDRETRERGATVYLPDRIIPLHPEVLSTHAASLLPGEDRPAYLWTFEVDTDGQVLSTHVELARVRSRAQLSYEQVQRAYDGHAALPAEVPADLPELLGIIGRLRQECEARRGGISLNLPEQRVERQGDELRLEFRELTDVEQWNSQISIMTGMAAAQMMCEANVGIIRTLPPADPRDVRRLRRVAAALGLTWDADTSYPDFVRSVHPDSPAVLAFLHAAVKLFRGAGYRALAGEDGENGAEKSADRACVSDVVECASQAAESMQSADSMEATKADEAVNASSLMGTASEGSAEDNGESINGSGASGESAGGDSSHQQHCLEHAAIAAPYAHVTAPLRRLVDRFGLEVCRCLCAGSEIPVWIREALPLLPAIMAADTARAGRCERRAISVVEALALRGREDEIFAGTVVEVSRGGRGTVIIDEPAVSAEIHSAEVESGNRVRVRLSHIDADNEAVFDLVSIEKKDS
ncbi:RNB domain-containing ribonuclease [Trueperella sp. LYQ141]|uniref:RNB domain-containing ribonuclease n=1 Tax=Trueperella sp. LYQ141 TaxID=3391058 RepID=UPI0039834423